MVDHRLRASRTLGFLLALGVWASGCQRSTPATEDSEGDSEGDSTPDSTLDSDSGDPVEPTSVLALRPMAGQNVVVIQIDTLRADHLPFYGYARQTTPRIQDLPWLVVTGLRPTAGWTLPSSASLMTGLSPQRHLLTFFYEKHVPSGPLQGVTFQERLQALGHATGLFSGNDVVSEYTGLDVGFDKVVIRMKSTPDSGVNGGGSMETIASDALAWIDTLPPGKPFHAHIQPMNLHQPVTVSQADLDEFRTGAPTFPMGDSGAYEYSDFFGAYRDASSSAEKAALNQSLLDVYDAALYGLDREIAIFIAGLDARGLRANTTIVITADHGETLNDEYNGYWGHSTDLREELTRAPFMVLQPDGEAGTTTCVSSGTDVWPTLWGAMGLEPVADIDGVDLAKGCRVQADSNRFSPEGVTDAAAGNEVGKIAVNCAAGRALGTNVGADADRMEQTPASDVNSGEALSAQIRSVLDAIPASSGGLACPFE